MVGGFFGCIYKILAESRGMWYKHNEYLLEVTRGKARFYNNNRVAFIGNDYTGIRMFIEASDNNLDVIGKFSEQLEKRESLERALNKKLRVT